MAEIFETRPKLSWRQWLDPLGYALAADLSPLDLENLQKETEKLAVDQPEDKAFRAGFLVLLKSHLKDGRAKLAESLHIYRDGSVYVGAHALMMDQLICHILDTSLARARAKGQFKQQPKLALMAIGGYGRGELAPFSDIDLMFVSAKRPSGAMVELVEAILYLLWDMGLTVGHSVRALDEITQIAKDDVTITTSLLEMRPICGDDTLAETLMTQVKKWVSQQNPLDFVQAKLAERDARHRQHGATRYVVEPQVKEGKGGLRDLHTLFWIAKFAYRISDITDAIALGVLRLSEARSFAASQRFLWTVRCFLHLRAGRADDRLAFDAQVDIAPQMGFHDRSGLRDVERFMRRYFLAARQAGNLTRIFCAAIETDFQSSPSSSIARFSLGRLFSFASAQSENKLAPFETRKGWLLLQSDLRFRDNPALIMPLFAHAQSEQLDIEPDTLRRVTRGIRASSVEALQSPDDKKLFLEILTSAHSPERMLRLMNESGHLGKFLPDFGRIVGMMQFDMYHSYTVDEHTIKAVGMLAKLEAGALEEDAPLASAVIHEIESRRALYVAVLLHDIAKGRGGDHSILGAEVAREVCPALGLTPEETETVIWLVRWHLLMSRIAFRYDLQDPKTIADFVETVQSPERLKLLLVLTVADIQAVGPNVWNGWKAALMRDLYHRANEVMGGIAPAEAAAMAAEMARDEARHYLEEKEGWSAAEFEEIASRFYASYWTSFGLSDHLDQIRLARSFDTSGKTLLLDITAEPEMQSSRLTIIAQDHPGLFSRIAGAVAMAGCQIVGARINTRKDGTILDVFRIQNRERQALSDAGDMARLRKLVRESLAGDVILKEELDPNRQRLSSRLAVMQIPPRVIVNNKMSKTHTVIEVNGSDRPGLLFDITRSLAHQGVQINSASVSTYGERAVDVFYVKDVFGLKIDKQTSIDKITKSVMDVIDKDGQSKVLSDVS